MALSVKKFDALQKRRRAGEDKDLPAADRSSRRRVLRDIDGTVMASGDRAEWNGAECVLLGKGRGRTYALVVFESDDDLDSGHLVQQPVLEAELVKKD